MSTTVTHGQLTTQIVVEGCVPMVDGRPKGKLPIKGVLLTMDQRGELGQLDPLRLRLDGQTIFYPIQPDGVFLDLGKEIATVWFNGADADRTLEMLETSLKQAFPQTRYIEERDHPDTPGMKVRFYIVDLTAPRFASLEVAYPTRGGDVKQFVVRVRGLMNPN
jgi:hypothetical protein